MNLENDFLIGDWIVRVRRDAIERDSTVVHLAPKAMAVLRCLAAADGKVVSREELFGTVWPGRVVTDDALTQRIVEVRKAFGDDPREAAIIETIPKVGFRLIAPVSPLPHDPSPADGERPPARARGTRLAVLTAMLAAVVVVATGLRWHGSADIAAVSEPPDFPQGITNSVVVLPFEATGEASVNAHLIDALHEEIITRLARIPSLRVISKTSVERFRDSDLTAPQFARKLEVAAAVTGSVQQVGDTVRIHIRLLDADTEKYLWARSFDRPLTAGNILTIQGEIAETVARSLITSLSPREASRVAEGPTDDSDAYEAILKGHIALRRDTPESFGEAIEHYRHALEINPELAQAYLALARAYTAAGERLGLAESQVLERVETYARAAIRLDPDSGLAYHHLGWVRREYGQLEESESLSRRAVALEPGNALILHGLGLTLRLQGKAREAVAYYDRAAELDPLSPLILESRGSLLRDLGRFDEAERQYLATLRVDPEFANVHWGLGTLYWSRGYPDQAITWFENAVQTAPNSERFHGWLALMYLELEQDTKARFTIDEALNMLGEDSDNDVVLIEELYRIYNGMDVSGLADGRRFMFRYWYGSILDLPLRPLLDGDYAAAVDEYEALFPGITEGALTVNAMNHRAALYVAFALAQLGRNEATATLLDKVEACLADLQRLGIHGYWVSDAQVLALRGDYAGSMERLEVAVDAGWRNLWRFYLLHDPILAELHEGRRYQALVYRVREDMRHRVVAHTSLDLTSSVP